MQFPRARRHEIAILCCDRSLSINPDNRLTWMTKGIALEKIGKHEEAMTAFANAKELDGAELPLDIKCI